MNRSISIGRTVASMWCAVDDRAGELKDLAPWVFRIRRSASFRQGAAAFKSAVTAIFVRHSVACVARLGAFARISIDEDFVF